MKSAEIRDYLQTLEQERGRITPAIVVEDAKRTSSPLHPLFDWNVKSAAERHWLHTARILIRRVRYLPTSQETVTLHAPFYVRDPRVPRSEQGYVSIATLHRSPRQARDVIIMESERAAAALRRALRVANVLHVEEFVDHLISEIESLQRSVEQEAGKADAA